MSCSPFSNIIYISDFFALYASELFKVKVRLSPSSLMSSELSLRLNGLRMYYICEEWHGYKGK